MQKIKLKIMPLVLSLTLLIGLFSPIAVTADDYPELAYDIESTYNLDPIDVEVVDGSDEASDEYEMEADKDDDDVVSDDDEYLPDLTYDLPDPEEPEEDELDFIEIIDIAPMSITIPGGHILGHEILNESGPFNVAANGHTQRARNTGTNWTANYLFESEITNFNQTGAIRLMVGHMGGDNNIYIEIGTGSSISLSTGGNLGWNWLASGTAPVAWSSNPISVRYAMMVMGNDVSIFVNDTHVLTHTFTAQNALDALAGGGIGWRSNWNSNATFTIANVKVTSIIAGQQGPPVDPLTITLDNDLTGIPEGSIRVASVTGTTAGSTLHYLVTPLPNTIAEPVVGSAITDYTGTTLFTVNTPIGTAVLGGQWLHVFEVDSADEIIAYGRVRINSHQINLPPSTAPNPLNLIPNGNFANGDLGWNPINPLEPNEIRNDIISGSTVLRVPEDSDGFEQLLNVPLKWQTTYVMTSYARRVGTNNTNPAIIGVDINAFGNPAYNRRTVTLNNAANAMDWGWRHQFFTVEDNHTASLVRAFASKANNNIAVDVDEIGLYEAIIVNTLPYQTVYRLGEPVDLTGLTLWVFNPDMGIYEEFSYDHFGFNLGVDETRIHTNSLGTQTVVVGVGIGTGNGHFNVRRFTFDIYVEATMGGVTVTDPDIGGVHRPINGRVPVSTITETAEFSGAVTWSPNHATFQPGQVYTATITLTAKPGYTLNNVPENFFNVPGAMSVINAADSGVITAVFPPPAIPAVMRNIDVWDFVAEMRVGWSLGNTLDALSDTGNAEGSWVRTYTTKAMIDGLAALGFDTLRLPVSWDTGGGGYERVGPGPDYTIAPWFLARVEEIVNWALIDNDMYVIINAHHDPWLYQVNSYEWDSPTLVANRAKVERIWTQIAEHFRDYGDKLILCTMNEPGNWENWGGSPRGFDNVNRYNQLIVDAIRSTGGNNEVRFIMTPTYAGATSNAHIDAFVVPQNLARTQQDPNIIGSLHSYAPTAFAAGWAGLPGSGNLTRTMTQAHRNDLNAVRNAFTRFTNHTGIPAILSEFGTINKTDDTTGRTGNIGTFSIDNGVITGNGQRAEHAAIMVQNKQSIPVNASIGRPGNTYSTIGIWWDNYMFYDNANNEPFGIFDRTNAVAWFPEIVDAMMQVAYGPGGFTPSDRIDIAAIGLSAPSYGRVPPATIMETAQFTGTVEWSPAAPTFTTNTTYTATITLTPKDGYTLTGVPAGFFTVLGAANVTNAANSGVITVTFNPIGQMRDIPATEFVRDIRLGLNLGNTLDAYTGGNANPETAWVSVVTTQATIQGIADAGFNTLRIPITWSGATGVNSPHRRVGPAPNFTVRPEFLDRVQEIVDWALDEDLYVIINTHHDDWNYRMGDDFPGDKDLAAALWTQIATRFMNYCDRLIFETMNEPEDSNRWWSGNPAGWEDVNVFNQLIVDAIRATGGNNAQRFIMVKTHSAGTSADHFGTFRLPVDPAGPDRLIVGVHSYAPTPFSFPYSGPSTNWSSIGSTCRHIHMDDEDLGMMDNLFDILYARFISQGYPVIISEFGSVSKWLDPADRRWDATNTTERVRHADYIVRGLRMLGIPVIYWDNNMPAQASNEPFHLFNRASATIAFPELMQAMIDVAYFDTVFQAAVVYNRAAEKWQIRAVLKNDGSNGEVFSGTINVLSPAGIVTNSSISYSNLRPGETLVRYFDINPNFNFTSVTELIDLNYTAHDSTLDVSSHGIRPFTVRFNYVTANFVANPITIDGDLNKYPWTDITNVINISDGLTEVSSGVYGPASALDPNDLSATAKLAWDSDYMYIAVEVTDDVHFNPHTGANILNGDSLRIILGRPDGRRMDPYGYNRPLDPGSASMGFALTDSGVEMWSWVNTPLWARNTPAAIPPQYARAAIVRDDAAGKTYYEIAIRWDYLYMEAGFDSRNDIRTDAFARISLSVNDFDNALDPGKFIEYGEGINVGVRNTGRLNLLLTGAVPEPEYAVNFTAGANGTIRARVAGSDISSGDQFPVGASVVFVANPASGYRVALWIVNGNPVTGAEASANSITRPVVAGGLTVAVTFEPIPSSDPDPERPSTGRRSRSLFPSAVRRDNQPVDVPSLLAAISVSTVRITQEGQASEDTISFDVVFYNIPDGVYRIGIEGLPAGTIAPEYLEAINGFAVLDLMGIEDLAPGDYTFTLILYDVDGSVIATDTFTFTVSEEIQETIIRFVIDDPAYTNNGVPGMTVDGIAPFIDPVYNRTMVPLRTAAEALGATVAWIEETRTVVIVRGTTTISLQVDIALPPDIHGASMGSPMIVQDRTFVPIAYVSLMLGADVRWDNEARAVYITDRR